MAEQQFELTPELIADLENLIIDPKLEVKSGILNILMQVLTTEEARSKFEDKPVFIKAFLNYINMEGLETAALTCLIQIAEDTIFHEQLHNSEAGDRIVNNMKDVVEQAIKENFEFTEKQALILQLSCLFLINFTQTVMGKNSFLSLSRDDQEQGINIMIMMKMFEHPKTAEMLKEFPNVLINISSYDTGRKLLVQKSNDFFRVCTKQIMNRISNLRSGVQNTIRNCLFEYEDDEFMDLLYSKEIDFYNTTCLAILKLIQSSANLCYKGMRPGQKSEKIEYVINEKLKEFQVDVSPDQLYDCSKGVEVDIAELTILIEYILILTNVDQEKHKPIYNKGLLKETVAIMQHIKLEEEISDKIEVLVQVFGL